MITALINHVESIFSTDQHDHQQSESGEWCCSEQLRCDHPESKQYLDWDDEVEYRFCECGAYLGCREKYT